MLADRSCMTNYSADRWVTVGHSADEVARAAGMAAAQGALVGAEAKLLIVFASWEYDLSELLAGVCAVAGDVPVIGCSTAGEIGPEPGVSARVVVVGVGGGGFDVKTSHATGLGEDPRAVGESVASALQPLSEREHRVVILLTDALAGDQQEMIRGAYGVFGASVPLVGGGAGDNLRMVTSRQFYGDHVLQDAVIAAVISSDSPFGIGIRHGWTRCSDAMVVTGSTGNVLHALDDRPALDVYLDFLDAPEGIEHDPVKFTDFALVHPLAVARRGDDSVRHVLGADPATRSVICAGSVPKGATAWMMEGDVASTLHAAEESCADAIAGLGGVAPLALLVFDCAGRRAVLGDDGMAVERRAMAGPAGHIPIGGFYTYGEIARTKGVMGFHNQTIVTLALS